MILRRLKTSWSVYCCLTRGLQNHLNLRTSIHLNEDFFLQNTGAVFNRICSRTIASQNKNNEYYGAIEDFSGSSDEQIMHKFVEKDLYPLTNESTLISMKPLVNLHEIFEHFHKFKHDYNAQTYTQALQKIWLYQQEFPAPQISTNYQLTVMLENMNETTIQQMDVEEVAYCLLYLEKLGVASDSLTINKLFAQLRLHLNSKKKVPLSTLSRLSYTISQRREFYDQDLCRSIISQSADFINNCNNPDTIYLIAKCFHNLILLIESEQFDEFNNKVSEMIDSNQLNDNHVKGILKISRFMTYPKWSSNASTTNRKLLLILSNKIELLDSRELETVFKLFQGLLEPAQILPILMKAARKKLENNSNAELLACVASFDQVNRKSLMEQAKTLITRELIGKSDTSKNLPSFFKLLRSLKISDLKFCDTYWSNVLRQVVAKAEEREEARLLKHCFRYMFFNNNMGGTFRHVEFEQVLGNEALDIIESKGDKYFPNFARLACFIIGYGIRDRKGFAVIPDSIVKSIEQMQSDFNYFDCLQISKGYQVASDLRYKHRMSKESASKMNRIETVVQKCVAKFLNTGVTSFNDVNTLVRILNNLRVPTTSELYSKAVDSYKTIPIHLDSRSIREVAFNLSASNYLVSEILTESFEYINKNRDYVLGDTVEKLLHTAYTLAYIPQNEEALFWSGEIIQRDFDYMTTMAIVQSCLALCFYRVLPTKLIEKIFTPDFIKRVEDEIELCYSKQTYPNRILNQVMQINRAVCLDYPETQIPWFQQNYIEAQMSKKPVLQSKISSEIESVLMSVVKDKKQILPNQTTPYGYVIDFVVHFDLRNKFLSSKFLATEQFYKFAILLLRKDSYCQNENGNIKGFEHLRMRHLEMLGFNVIHINLTDWNALHMNIPGAKTMFLKNLLKLE